MQAQEILLTTPCYPYPTLPANDSMTDATGQRFTKGDDLFTIISHTHCYANHILAQNIEPDVICLEYPRWEDFTAEVDKGYPLIGISAYPPHLDRVMEMCLYIRKRSPATQILLGSYAGMAFRAAYDEDKQKQYVDHVVHGEGVKFLRELLGEDTDRPITQTLMPKGGGAPSYISTYPAGTIGFLVSGLGCIGGCDFCSTTTLFDQKRIELLSPEGLVNHMQLYHDHCPDLSQVFVIEEDHFRHPAYLNAMRDHWHEKPEVLERMDWFGFGSIDHIGRFAEKYGWSAIPELGIGCVFVGVESKFAGEHGYDKREKVDAREVFERLHGMGIRTVGAWICGWDFHDHNNIMEDLNYFVSLYPTYQQLTRLSPFPGTPLWERLQEEDRLHDVPWEDVHFWSGAQKNIALEPHETLNLTEYGYDLLYQTWGPSVLRRLDVQLSGYAYCMRSESDLLRRHRSKFLKKQSAMLWCMLAAMDRHAPNGVVRRRVRKIDEKYRALLGEPTAVMRALSVAIDGMATARKLKEFYDPLNRHPKEEPFKRYVYEKNGHGFNGNGNGSNGNGVNPFPYRIEMPKAPLGIRLGMETERAMNTALAKALKVTRLALWKQTDPLIDDFLVDTLDGSWMGFGF